MVSPMALGMGRVEPPTELKRAPQRILAARSLDEFAYLLRGSRANLLAVAPFPFPEQAEPLAVSANDCLGLDDDNGVLSLKGSALKRHRAHFTSRPCD